MSIFYENKYHADDFYWGKQPSSMARIFLSKFPPMEGQRLMEIGCGEGRDAVFFARSGFRVTAFDYSAVGVQRAQSWASELNLSIEFFHADINAYRLKEHFHVVFSSGALQYIPQGSREEIILNYKQFTRPGGVHAFMVPVYKPFLPKDPSWDVLEQDWKSGEILTYYHDWVIEYFSEEIEDEPSGYKFPFNRMIARKPPAEHEKEA